MNICNNTKLFIIFCWAEFTNYCIVRIWLRTIMLKKIIFQLPRFEKAASAIIKNCLVKYQKNV